MKRPIDRAPLVQRTVTLSHSPLVRGHAWRGCAITLCTLVLTACSGPAAGDRDSSRAVARSAGGVDSAATAGTLLVAPPLPPIPDGPVGESVRRGHAILTATADSLPGHVGNELRCTSCHLDDGRRPNAMPWTGVYARFPQYRSREATVARLEDRINGCFKRSMNGQPLPFDDAAMRDMVAYMAHLSQGVEVGEDVPGSGLPRIEQPLVGDTIRGRAVWAAECARCHGAEGEGTEIAPAVWGPSSFNIGAGMARVRTAAAFVRVNMPYDRPGTLTDQQAFDVAAYFTSRPRPDFPGKENDWPAGDPPPDAAYQTRAGRRQ